MWSNLLGRDPKMDLIYAEGEAKGMIAGKIRASQRMLLDIIEVRFPRLAEPAKQPIKRVRRYEKLIQLAKEIAFAPDEATARRILGLYSFTTRSLRKP
jgi:hypothetical protein